MKNSNLPKCLGCHIPLYSHISTSHCRHYLNYWDQQHLDLLEFSFPLDYDRDTKLQSTKLNHKLALDYPDHIDTYIQEELHLKAMYCPFEEKTV